MKGKGRTEWLIYTLGYMTAKGWRISKEDAESFKEAFPEVPDRYIEFVVEKESG